MHASEERRCGGGTIRKSGVRRSPFLLSNSHILSSNELATCATHLFWSFSQSLQDLPTNPYYFTFGLVQLSTSGRRHYLCWHC
jgi:hypothetical protein